MTDPFTTPHDSGVPPWWLRDPSDEELVRHQRLRDELTKLEREWRWYYESHLPDPK